MVVWISFHSDDWIDIKRLPARVENVEGDFSSVARDLNVDKNGFAPIQWGAWKTNWTGERLISRQNYRSRTNLGGGRRLGRLGPLVVVKVCSICTNVVLSVLLITRLVVV